MRLTLKIFTCKSCFLVTALYSTIARGAQSETAGSVTGIAAIDPFSAESLFRMFGGLLLVLVLVVALVWGLKKLQRLPVGSADSIQLVGALSVGQREKVVVVQLGEVQLVLAVCAGRIDFLHTLQKPLPNHRPLNAPSSFSEKMTSVLGTGVLDKGLKNETK